jgi:hypothetical protein
MQKRDNTPKIEKRTDIESFVLFWGKVFDMDFLQTYFVVFLNSPYRETPKNALKLTKTKQRRKRCRWLVGYSGANQIYVGVGPRHFFGIRDPRNREPTANRCCWPGNSQSTNHIGDTRFRLFFFGGGAAWRGWGQGAGGRGQGAGGGLFDRRSTHVLLARQISSA